MKDICFMSTSKNASPALKFDETRAWVIDLSNGRFLDMPSQEVCASYTKMLWIKSAQPDPSGGNLISSSVLEQSRVHYMWYEGSYLQAGHSQTGAIAAFVRDPEPTPSEEWIHFSVTYDNDIKCMKLYRNAKLVDSSSNAAFDWRGGAAHVQIGAYGYANTFEGFVDGVRIFDRALSDEEVHHHFVDSSKKAR